MALERVLITQLGSHVVEVMQYRQTATGLEALIVTSDPVAMFWVRVASLTALTDT